MCETCTQTAVGDKGEKFKFKFRFSTKNKRSFRNTKPRREIRKKYDKYLFYFFDRE